ncbi:hypothetical protein [Bacillus cereus group sp. TH152-1LC]|uniref:hypothetical protein n=1 Tax=Bacillus cereus group sp. TH152-1LC TaxID=3018060 RepID=UPI0022E68227|nr:hypothetical protein [Bacillus cereus group sp. TH152-1LC]MDA1675188.1 hypothetical protein [Bacillus cereus group sp. TH152-1LC]
MIIKQNIADVLKNKGETREIFKKELQEFCEECVYPLGLYGTISPHNNEDMKKIDQDFVSYISNNDNHKEIQKEVLEMVKELPRLESLIFLKSIVHGKGNDVLCKSDELYYEFKKRSGL